MANALLGHFAEKLPVSRLQRDLTDSTVMRTSECPLAQCHRNECHPEGLGKLVLNGDKIAADLVNWAIVAEAIQTILRREATPSLTKLESLDPHQRHHQPDGDA